MRDYSIVPSVTLMNVIYFLRKRQPVQYVLHAYALPKVRTNYGKFRIKFIGAKVWNALDADLKTLSFRTFKARLKENFTLNY